MCQRPGLLQSSVGGEGRVGGGERGKGGGERRGEEREAVSPTNWWKGALWCTNVGMSYCFGSVIFDGGRTL